MKRRPSFGSVFWGILLVSVGSLFLARNLGYQIPLWYGLARYWPVVLIAWGLVKIGDYYLQRRGGENRSLFSAGEVILLILVILAGSSLTAAANLSPDLGFLLEMANVDLWDVTGNSYQYTEHHELDADPASLIQIINRWGNVEIAPNGTENRIVVDIQKTIIAEDQQQADKMAAEFGYSIVHQGAAYQVYSNFNRDQNSVRGRRFKTTLTLRVPKESKLDVGNRNGNVRIANVAGSHKVENAFGEIDIHGITGIVEVRNSNGNVDVDGVTEGVTIQNSFASVTVKNVGGDLKVDNRNGDLQVTDVMGAATLSNAFASIEATGIKGDLKIRGRNNGVEVNNVTGAVSVETSFQNVSVRGSSGPVNIDNRNGDVLLGLVAPLKSDVSISSQFGNVTLEIPATASFAFDGRTRFGTIDSEFRELDTSANNDRQDVSINGRVGQGGPQVHVDNRNGDIHIEKKGQVAHAMHQLPV